MPSTTPDFTALAEMSLEELYGAVKAAHEHWRRNRLEFFKPYPKQQEFFKLGAQKTERLLMAGNQLGKTEGGAAECAYHLTGLYPAWWRGRRFKHAVEAWAAGESTVLVRDVQQLKLLGPPGVQAEWGTGLIPADCIKDWSMSKGVTDAIDTIYVQHYTAGVADGVSTLTFKSYEQGRKKFQGRTLNLCWLDEEPPQDIYTECIARITATGGMLYLTFTPLSGMSQVVLRFLGDEATQAEGRGYVRMGFKDAPHMTEEKVKIALEGYPLHEHKARMEGIPLLGSGAVFRAPEEQITTYMPLDRVPHHWAKIWGIDFGIGHPFAAVLLAWDRDRDAVYILAEVKMSDATPGTHAQAMRRIAADVPVAWPHDGNSRDKGSGIELAKLYKPPYLADGLRMLPTHAQLREGGYQTEAGISLMDSYMRGAGDRFKVNDTCIQWLEEYRLYHRKDGQIVRTMDDLMSATRQAMMSLRFAKAGPLGSKVAPKAKARNYLEQDGLVLF